MATIRTSGLPADFHVKPWVQSFVDAVAHATGLDSFGTYAGHEPTADLAVDIFVPVNDPAPGTRVCAFTGAPPFATSGPPSADFVGKWAIDYVIFRQHIYNPEISHDWRLMEDRGGVTQNHFDHVHVSFNATAPQQGDDMPLSDEDIKKIANAVVPPLVAILVGDNNDPGVKPITQAIRKELGVDTAAIINEIDKKK